MVKIFFYVDQERCIGCGACVLISDKLFKLEKNKARELKRVVESEEEREMVLRAAKCCPKNAIVYEILEE